MSPHWAEEEFGAVDLGDQRLNRRLVTLARQRGQAPHASIPVSTGNRAGTRGAYRFYAHEGVSREQILAPHRQATLRRLGEQRLVLAVQDTTPIDLTAHPHTEGTGYLQDLAHTGFLLHSTLMVTPQRQPLGLLQQQVWTRDPAEFGKRHTRHQRPTRDKESQKWLTSLQAVAEAQSQLPDTRLVSVGDSEADAYAVFAEAERLQVAFLVRACRERRLADEPETHLWQHLAQQAVLGTLEVAVPRQADRPARRATLSVRLARVSLAAPPRAEAGWAAQVAGWALLVREEGDLPEGERIEWQLLTNVPTDDLAQARERVGWYTCRWVVEMFHKVLKSGCRLEQRQFDDVANTQRFLAVDSVVAWRVLFLTLTGRQQPELSCEAVLEIQEWQALYCFIHHTSQPPAEAPSLGEALRWIAQLGGFRASRTTPPGTQVVWQGLQRLTDLAQAWLLFHDTS